MDNLLSYINKKVKKIEKHLDIKLCIQGEEIDTAFERFVAFSYDEADIVLCSADTSRRFKLHYDFNTGYLKDAKTGEELEIEDLFSRRHLRSILFTAHETLFLKTTEDLSPLTKKLHKKNPVPLMPTEFGNEKKWFLIERIDVVSDSSVKMNGILSIDKEYIHLPVKATCSFNIKRKTFTWDYMLYGKREKGKEPERYYNWYNIRMYKVLYDYTEVKIENILSLEGGTSLQMLERDMLKILKNQQIHIFTAKTERDSDLCVNYIYALFWGIKSVTDEQIVLLACNDYTLSKEVIFNRINRKIYADMPGVGKTRLQEMRFINNEDEKRKFEKVIRLIERQFKST